MDKVYQIQKNAVSGEYRILDDNGEEILIPVDHGHDRTTKNLAQVNRHLAKVLYEYSVKNAWEDYPKIKKEEKTQEEKSLLVEKTKKRKVSE